MAESKTYKGKRGNYYGEPHQARLGDYLVTPIDTVRDMGMQNNPGDGQGDQFGSQREEKKIANPPATE